VDKAAGSTALEMIHTTGYPRAALIGNPSDGFHGRTIAFTFSNFSAQLTVTESARLILINEAGSQKIYCSLDEFDRQISVEGYDPDFCLVEATIQCFMEYSRESSQQLSDACFTMTFQSSIPFQVGLAGSSAIIIAALRGLARFYSVSIAKPILANLALRVETVALGIPGGLQDRVVQVYQGLVSMNFDKKLVKKQGYGHYEYLKLTTLPQLYIAYRESFSEGSQVFHNDIRQRFERGDQDIIEAVETWKTITLKARDALTTGRHGILAKLMDQNFDLRAGLYDISRGNLEMIRIARQCGASAKFTGSGGAAVGTYTSDQMYQELCARLGEKNIVVFKPVIVEPYDAENH